MRFGPPNKGACLFNHAFVAIAIFVGESFTKLNQKGLAKVFPTNAVKPVRDGGVLPHLVFSIHHQNFLVKYNDSN